MDDFNETWLSCVHIEIKTYEDLFTPWFYSFSCVFSSVFRLIVIWCWYFVILASIFRFSRRVCHFLSALFTFFELLPKMYDQVQRKLILSWDIKLFPKRTRRRNLREFRGGGEGHSVPSQNKFRDLNWLKLGTDCSIKILQFPYFSSDLTIYHTICGGFGPNCGDSSPHDWIRNYTPLGWSHVNVITMQSFPLLEQKWKKRSVPRTKFYNQDHIYLTHRFMWTRCVPVYANPAFQMSIPISTNLNLPFPQKERWDLEDMHPLRLEDHLGSSD